MLFKRIYEGICVYVWLSLPNFPAVLRLTRRQIVFDRIHWCLRCYRRGDVNVDEDIAVVVDASRVQCNELQGKGVKLKPILLLMLSWRKEREKREMEDEKETPRPRATAKGEAGDSRRAEFLLHSFLRLYLLLTRRKYTLGLLQVLLVFFMRAESQSVTQGRRERSTDTSQRKEGRERKKRPDGQNEHSRYKLR